MDECQSDFLLKSAKKRNKPDKKDQINRKDKLISALLSIILNNFVMIKNAKAAEKNSL